jgi:hypothetical protein
MRRGRVVLLLFVLFITACSPLGPAATPTLTPSRLADAAMQQAALGAVQQYAAQLSYEYRNPSFSVLQAGPTQVVVHVTVGFQTRKGFPFEDYDALFFLNKVGTGWQADPIKTTTRLTWPAEMQRGPTTLKSAAGFTVNVPAGWAGYVAPASELKPANVCGVGLVPNTGVQLLVVAPAGYSEENAPVALRGYQQCPRASTLGVIRQRIESIRSADKTLLFERLEIVQLGGQSSLLTVFSDPNGSVAYDNYVLYRERQLEFVIMSYGGQDATPLLGVLNGIQFN